MMDDWAERFIAELIEELGAEFHVAVIGDEVLIERKVGEK